MYNKIVFERVLKRLDAWLIEENREALHDGMAPYPVCSIRLVGQTALFEQKLDVPLAVTRDVDVKADYEESVRRVFEALLAKEGLELDPVGHEAWMPPETEYALVYDGRYVKGFVADIESVLASKASRAPEKNRQLIVDYLARGPSERFLALAQTHGIDLEAFV